MDFFQHVCFFWKKLFQKLTFCIRFAYILRMFCTFACVFFLVNFFPPKKWYKLFFIDLLLVNLASTCVHMYTIQRCVRPKSLGTITLKKNKKICAHIRQWQHCMLPFRTQINTFFTFLMLLPCVHKYRHYVAQVGYVSTYAMYVAYVFDRMRMFTPNVEKRRKKTFWVTFVRLLRSDQTQVKKARHEDLFVSRHE